MFNTKVCQWLDLIWGPLESEATALPTEPPLLPLFTGSSEPLIIRIRSWFGGQSAASDQKYKTLFPWQMVA